VKVESNKKDFVQKMLPIVDAFRDAPEKAPASTERQENMHKNFGSLLSGILTVFNKFGYEEFYPGIFNLKCTPFFLLYIYIAYIKMQRFGILLILLNTM
jgi:hypothetical protein